MVSRWLFCTTIPRNWGAGCKDKLDAARSTWRATETKQAETDATIKALNK